MTGTFEANWPTQLRKGVLELSILIIIRRERLYGYQIVSQLRDVEGLVVTEGTIYPILSRLRKEGLLQSTLEESPDGPPRKYYTLTGKGRERLNWMNERWESLIRGVAALRDGV